jgi:hypothetical protein
MMIINTFIIVVIFKPILLIIKPLKSPPKTSPNPNATIPKSA